MSIQAIEAVLDADIPNVHMKMLLVCLANAHNGVTGACFPPRGRLVRESGMPLATVRKYLKRLEAEGYIRKGRNFDASNGRQLANSYTLTLLGEGLHRDPSEGLRGSRGEGLHGDPSEGLRGSRGRGYGVAGGGATLVSPSKDTGINIKKARADASARADANTKVSRITDPDLFAECERVRGKSAPVDQAGAWTFPSDIVDRARGNLLRAGEEGDAA